MIILTTSTGAQTVSVIPRSYSTDIFIRLVDESTGEVTEYALDANFWDTTNTEWQLANFNWNSTTGGSGSASIDKGYLVISNAYSLVENRFYEFYILDSTGIIYRDKVFCTDQTISEYSVNDGQYVTENSYDNDYIII